LSQTTHEAHGLVKKYGGKVSALDGLSFAVEAGEVFTLLGRVASVERRDTI
jgi:ABC-type multidrug transport system ATPase subunit